MRANGILMHISSLPSKYGIGTLGYEAKRFVDFLKKAGQTYWQVLPICPTGFGDSPYQSFSSYAGNPYFIDFDILKDNSLLHSDEYDSIIWSTSYDKIDYETLYFNRYKVLKKAYYRFDHQNNNAYKEFCRQNAFWLNDYALFMALKNQYNGASFDIWPTDIKLRNTDAIKKAQQELCEPIEFEKVMQFWFFEQWFKLKSYANENGIKIIGDIPIYVSKDSADLWSEPDQFDVTEDFTPREVAGVPPDEFTADGQLWGNPLYNWKQMKKDNYTWWCRRIEYASTIYDVIRIDHFRGFDSYYCVPYSDTNAKNGIWRKGPGMKLFNAISAKLGPLPIIAEDLGYLTPSVHKLLKNSGFPGMKVMQFAFDPEKDSEYLPHNYNEKCVVYTGTHDNDTILGWFSTAPTDQTEFAKEYLRLNDAEGYNWGMIKAAMSSKAMLCIVTMQDLIALGSEGRMNTPAQLGGNWQWRVGKDCINDWLASILYRQTKIYKRLPISTEE